MMENNENMAEKNINAENYPAQIPENITNNKEPDTNHLKRLFTNKVFLLIIAGIVIIVGIVITIIFHNINENNKIAANEVIELINNMGEPSVNFNKKITSAHSAYEKLTNAQKKLVSNYADLDTAYNEQTKIYDTLQTLIWLKGNFEIMQSSCEAIFKDTSTVWYNAIWEVYDNYNKGNYDFNTAIKALYSDDNTSMTALLSILKDTKKSMDDGIDKLPQNPPNELKSACDIARKLQEKTSEMYELAINPVGSYNSYKQKVLQLKLGYTPLKDVFEGAMPSTTDSKNADK